MIFLSKSSIHGFTHIAATKRHPVEILIWWLLVAAAVYGAFILSSLTLTRYIENPTVISMERDRFEWNTTFPAATICPTIKINEALLDYYVENSIEKNKTQLKQFLITLSQANYYNLDQIVPYEGITEEEYLPLLLDLQFNFKPSVSNSGIDGRKYSLQKIVSEMGICYCFNSKLAIYSSPE